MESERTSDPITVVTLHGKPEKYDGTESLAKLPNVHFSIYGAHNQDLYVWKCIYIMYFLIIIYYMNQKQYYTWQIFS